MNTQQLRPQGNHHGNNIRNLRHLLRVKQFRLACALNITQQAISKLEKKAFIDDLILEKVAHELQISVDMIKKGFCFSSL